MAWKNLLQVFIAKAKNGKGQYGLGKRYRGRALDKIKGMGKYMHIIARLNNRQRRLQL